MQFVNENLDLDALAHEIYEFCPDVVDQGTGSVEALKLELETTNTMFLWWD